MPKSAAAKITLDKPITIPLDKLVIHPDNVRTIDVETEIDELAADIGSRGLLQSLSVQKLFDGEGKETGFYGVQAGGRRWRALKLLVKQKKLAKDAPTPCMLREDGYVEADSLAENTARTALHPLDQFRACASMSDKGLGDETIAVALNLSVKTVRQRLRMAKASPIILKAYKDDEISLEQLMAFCLVEDHKRQDEVWTIIQKQWNKGPDVIRRLLTEKTVRADDRRALYIGEKAYKAAGGLIIKDLFDEDEDGWLQDVPLLERLAGEKLETEADAIRAEGWKWVQCAVDFPWNHKRGYLPVQPETAALTDGEQEEYDLLAGEFDELEERRDELAEDEWKRRDDILARIDELEAKSPIFAPKMIAKAGVFVSLDHTGKLVIDRGYIHPDDIRKQRTAAVANDADGSIDGEEAFDPETGEIIGSSAAPTKPETDEDNGPAIPERLKVELTAYRTLALRDALANNPGIAFIAVLHALAERLFFISDQATSSLQIQANDTLTSSFPGLAGFKANKAIEARHETWLKAMPENVNELWSWLISLDRDSREALFAHCAGLTVNAVYQASQYRGDAKIAHGDTLATALGLEMAAAGWTTTAENYFGRITKAAILDAMREAKGEETVELLADLKKKDMAQEAERLIDGTGWLPELLRTPEALDEIEGEAAETALPAFLDEPQLQAAE